VRSTVVDGVKIETQKDKDTVYELPLKKCGDYAITVTDEESRSSFGREFYLSDWGDNVVRAPLSDPSKVSIHPDKAFYRVGEMPHLVVKSPFAGHAILSVMRDTHCIQRLLRSRMLHQKLFCALSKRMMRRILMYT
jgi:uncharacterized protein YfaS (alpha-2-macroglobulin family)